MAVRISLLVAAACLITAVVAGTLAINLIRKGDTRSASQTLSRLADATQATADQGFNAAAGQSRATQTLRALKIDFVRVASTGVVTGGSNRARSSLSAADISTVLTGGTLSLRRRVGGQELIVEGRGIRNGAIVLIQRRADATAGGDQAIRRILIGLVIGSVLAIALGLVVARQIAKPLRRTAAAAHALALGYRDVTVPAAGPVEVAEVGEAVNLLAAALTLSETRQREFLLSVSHELRTPLTAISGYAESLAEGVIPPAQAAEAATVIGTEAQRLTRLVGDLLDLARLGADEFRLDFARVDLAELARSAGQVWTARCAEVDIALRLELPDQPVWAWTDAFRLRQVLDGLLENALRVTPSKAPIVLAVRVLTLDRVIAEIRDGGPGLTDDDLAVAFERSALYQRYRGLRRVGTGLGLAIVHGLVVRLGGQVEAGHSREGGARFTIELPTALAARPH